MRLQCEVHCTSLQSDKIETGLNSKTIYSTEKSDPMS